jgi:hypothetical protein
VLPKTYPISVQSLQGSLPHRAPMIWIDRVLEGTETEGVCEVVLDPTGPQFADDGLRQSALVEWMAQGLGYFRASVSAQVSDRTYVAALKDIRYCSSEEWLQFRNSIVKGTRARVYLKIQRVLGPIFLVEGEVKTEEGKPLAHGTFKCFAGA